MKAGWSDAPLALLDLALSNLPEKKITDHKHDKFITTPEFNKLTTENFVARLAEENLVTKSDFGNKL